MEADSMIASFYSVADVTVPTFLLTFVNELKLCPFALTVDNGFMPHETMQNIDNAVRILGVKYMYVWQTVPSNLYRPDLAMTAFICNCCQGSIKKAVIKIAHDNGVCIVIGGISALVGSEYEPEGSFAELLLRLVPRVCDWDLFLVCGAFVRLLLNHVYLSCHTHEKRIPDFGYRPWESDRHWPFWLSWVERSSYRCYDPP